MRHLSNWANDGRRNDPSQSRTTAIVHRDPETGQFVAGRHDSFDDIEVASFAAAIGIQAADLSGATTFTGGDQASVENIELVDYDDIVDRNERLQLLYAAHRLVVYINSTETADGSCLGAFEISSSPSKTVLTSTGPGTTAIGEGDPAGDVVGRSRFDDTIDLIGRPLTGFATGPFSDGATGVGGGGAQGEDTIEMTEFPAEMGSFHPRDELFLNGQFRVWNVDDAGVHAQIEGQHVYGVFED